MRKRTTALAAAAPVVAAVALIAPIGGQAQAACTVSSHLTEGQRGSDQVRCLQAALNNAGVDSGPVDGWFGPVTHAAVLAYQQAKGLRVDGWVGSQTAGSLGIWATGNRSSGITHTATPTTSSGGSGSPTPGNCDSYVPLFQKYGLPVGTFKAIAWRESGCNHRSFVIDNDDAGGGLLGINLKDSNAAVWNRWCGATLGNITNAEVNVHCAGVAYDIMGLRPWS